MIAATYPHFSAISVIFCNFSALSRYFPQNLAIFCHFSPFSALLCNFPQFSTSCFFDGFSSPYQAPRGSVQSGARRMRSRGAGGHRPAGSPLPTPTAGPGEACGGSVGARTATAAAAHRPLTLGGAFVCAMLPCLTQRFTPSGKTVLHSTQKSTDLSPTVFSFFVKKN